MVVRRNSVKGVDIFPGKGADIFLVRSIRTKLLIYSVTYRFRIVRRTENIQESFVICNNNCYTTLYDNDNDGPDNDNNSDDNSDIEVTLFPLPPCNSSRRVRTVSSHLKEENRCPSGVSKHLPLVVLI